MNDEHTVPDPHTLDKGRKMMNEEINLNAATVITFSLSH